MANEKLKKVMAEKDISPQDLCRLMKSDKSTVYYLLENDIAKRPRKIAGLLGVKVMDVIDEETK